MMTMELCDNVFDKHWYWGLKRLWRHYKQQSNTLALYRATSRDPENDNHSFSWGGFERLDLMLGDNSSSKLGDAVALAVIDDWLVQNLVDTPELCMRKMGKNLPGQLMLFPGRTHDGRVLGSCAIANAAQPKTGFKGKNDATLAASLEYIRTFLMKRPSPELMSFLTTLYRRRRYGSHQLTFEPIRKALPDGFSDSHVRLLMHQCNLYLYYRMPWTPYKVVPTFQYGCEAEAAVVANVRLNRGEIISNLYGTTVEMTADDEKLLSGGEERWDFSVISSSRLRYGVQLFLGPARFVNHDCSPNVEVRNIFIGS